MFQLKLGRLWAVTNNVPYSQFRNLVERKVSLLKKVMKQVISGMPGPNKALVSRDLLHTAILMATSTVNNTPYQEVVGSNRLLAPADFIAPWRTTPPSVKDLPSSTLKSLAEAKRQMMLIQESIRELVREEIITSPERFKQSKVRLGSNKTSPPAMRGDIVLTELPNQVPELGSVVIADNRNVTLRRADGRTLQLPVAACTVVTPATLSPKMASREDGEFTHFISLECQEEEQWGPFRHRVLKLQEEIAQVFPSGKKAKVESVHLTIGTLLLNSGEVEKVEETLKEITEQFIQMRGSTFGLVITFDGVGWGDGGTVWAEIKVGAKAISAFREMVEDKLGEYLTDWRFHAHLTVYRGVEATKEEKERLRASLAGTTLAPINLVVSTLRERKVQKQALKPPLLQIPLGSDLEEGREKETIGGVMMA